MPHLTLPLTSDGPVVEVLIGVTPSQSRSLTVAGQPVPGPVTARGLIDTGASVTCIDSQLVRTLGLQPSGSTLLMLPVPSGGAQQYQEFEISLILLHARLNYSIGTLTVVAAPLTAQGIEVLLGRDVLKSCLLVYDGEAASFTLAF
jgi:predicted aspartyl protease